MHRQPLFPRLIAFAASFGLHALLIAAALSLQTQAIRPSTVTPVNIVDVPREILRQLPPLSRPTPHPSPQEAAPVPPVRPAPPVEVPRTEPSRGTPEGSDRGRGTADTTSPLGTADSGKGPLPFLSQADIDELAKKGMPEAKPGDNSVTLDTDEFKFISYNRWLKVKVESVLKYPELAALSGIQGTLYIRFDILKDGTLGDLELLKSSGYKILDDEALRAIRSAAPFQPLPEDWRMERYPIRAAVLFYLNDAYIR